MQNRCLGVFLVFLAAPFVILSIMFISSLNLLKVDYYKDLLVKTDSYNKITSMAHNTQSDNPLVKSLTSDVNSKWVRTSVEYNLDVAGNFINKKSNNANFMLDLAPFRADIAKQLPAGINISVPDQLSYDTYSNFLLTFKEALVTAEPQISQKDLENLDNLINSSDKLSSKTNQDLINIRRGINFYKISGTIVIALTILWLFLIAILARKHLPAIPRWIGQALFLPSLFFVLTILLLKQVLLNISPLNNVNMSSDLKSIFQSIYLTFTKGTLDNLIFYGSITIIIGFLLVIVSYIWDYAYRNRSQEQIAHAMAQK